MADRALDLTDPANILQWVRAIVAELTGRGAGLEAAKRVAPAARLGRLGLGVPDYDALQDSIRLAFNVDVTVLTTARVGDVADAIVAAMREQAPRAGKPDPLDRMVKAAEGLMP